MRITFLFFSVIFSFLLWWTAEVKSLRYLSSLLLDQRQQFLSCRSGYRWCKCCSNSSHDTRETPQNLRMSWFACGQSWIDWQRDSFCSRSLILPTKEGKKKQDCFRRKKFTVKLTSHLKSAAEKPKSRPKSFRGGFRELLLAWRPLHPPCTYSTKPCRIDHEAAVHLSSS